MQSNVFNKIGVLMALSIANGGVGFPFMYKGVYEYICGKDVNEVATSEEVIPELTVKETIRKVSGLYVGI